MDTQVAHILNDATSAFYCRCAQSFSDTRQSPWRGWEPLLPPLKALCDSTDGRPLRILDVGCGNGRFLRFLEQHLPSQALAYTGIDNCEGLRCFVEAPESSSHPTAPLSQDSVISPLHPSGESEAPPATPSSSPAEAPAHHSANTLIPVDLMSALIDEQPLEQVIPSEPFDVVVCFGVLHHGPGTNLRSSLIQQLASRVAPRGILACSLWRFDRSASLRAKAEQGTPERLHALGLSAADLEAGDWLLGWQQDPEAIRYCHCFSDAEVQELSQVPCPPLTLTETYDADGASGNLNTYLLWQRSVCA